MPEDSIPRRTEIDAKEAAKIATEYYRDVTRDFDQTSVEEIEVSDDKKYWLITLGIRKTVNDTVSALYGKTRITYKVFQVDAENGDVLSMKIKEI
jgi:hypothetical protein